MFQTNTLRCVVVRPEFNVPRIELVSRRTDTLPRPLSIGRVDLSGGLRNVLIDKLHIDALLSILRNQGLVCQT